MEVSQRLAERIHESTIADGYGPEDEVWHRFVRDHKAYLRSKATKKYYTPEQILKYKYRPEEFFVAETDGDYSMAWIFLFINDIREPAEFNESRNHFLMLNKRTITDLYNLFSGTANSSYERV